MSDARLCPKGHGWYVGLDYSCPTCRRDREREQERQAKAAAERKDADEAVRGAIRCIR